jgi:hypothetical protein
MMRMNLEREQEQSTRPAAPDSRAPTANITTNVHAEPVSACVCLGVQMVDRNSGQTTPAKYAENARVMVFKATATPPRFIQAVVVGRSWGGNGWLYQLKDKDTNEMLWKNWFDEKDLRG